MIISAGVNDLLRRRLSTRDDHGHTEAIHRALVGAGATIAWFTMPDLSAFMPIARLVRPP